MKINLNILFILLFTFLLFTGCGKTRPIDKNASSQDINQKMVFDSGSDTDLEFSTGNDNDLAQSVNQEDIAELYRTVYLASYKGDNVSVTLSSDNISIIAALLGAEGFVACDSAGSIDVTNPQLVYDFFDAIQAKQDAGICIYQIYSDGGFFSHSINSSASGISVVQTRLAWLDDGKFALPGENPTITFTDTFEVKSISLIDGYLHYEYYIPNNPPGSNHDGHIDPVENIRIFAP